jgi:hypothetical protein
MDDLLLISEAFRFPRRKFYWQMKFLAPRIYLFNWQKKKIIKKLEPPPAYFDSEEYRPLRLCYHYSGARGITANDKYIFIALQNAILVYDAGLKKQVGRIDHRLFNGIHEIVWHRDRLYVCCAATDSILALSEDGRELENHYLGNSKYFLEMFHLTARELDNRLDYRLMHRTQRLFHVNNVDVKEGNIYVNLNRQGSFAKIFPRQEIIVHDSSLRQSHNGQFSPDGMNILILDTGNNALRVYDALGQSLQTIDFSRFPLPVDFKKKRNFGRNHDVRAGWLRGLAFSSTSREIVYVGFSPTMVAAVNYRRGEFVDCFQFRSNIGISVHGLHNLCAGNFGGIS